MNPMNFVNHPLLVIGALELRKEMYENFSVLEPHVNGVPHYLGSCRTCSKLVVQIARADEVSVAPLYAGLVHIRTCHQEVKHE